MKSTTFGAKGTFSFGEIKVGNAQGPSGEAICAWNKLETSYEKS